MLGEPSVNVVYQVVLVWLQKLTILQMGLRFCLASRREQQMLWQLRYILIESRSRSCGGGGAGWWLTADLAAAL